MVRLDRLIIRSLKVDKEFIPEGNWKGFYAQFKGSKGEKLSSRSLVTEVEQRGTSERPPPGEPY